MTAIPANSARPQPPQQGPTPGDVIHARCVALQEATKLVVAQMRAGGRGSDVLPLAGAYAAAILAAPLQD